MIVKSAESARFIFGRWKMDRTRLFIELALSSSKIRGKSRTRTRRRTRTRTRDYPLEKTCPRRWKMEDRKGDVGLLSPIFQRKMGRSEDGKGDVRSAISHL